MKLIMAFFIATLFSVGLYQLVQKDKSLFCTITKTSKRIRAKKRMLKRRSKNKSEQSSVSGFKLGSYYAGSVDLVGKTLNSLNAGGSVTLRNVKIKNNLNVSGSTKLNDVSIGGKAKVSGMFKANKSAMQELYVSGSTELKKVTIKQDTKISGSLKTDNCILQNVSIASENIILIDTTVKNIEIKKINSWLPKTQVVELIGSTVDGDITFEQTGGKVILKKGAKVMGRIIGGSIKN